MCIELIDHDLSPKIDSVRITSGLSNYSMIDQEEQGKYDEIQKFSSFLIGKYLIYSIY